MLLRIPSKKKLRHSSFPLRIPVSVPTNGLTLATMAGIISSRRSLEQATMGAPQIAKLDFI